MRGMRGAVVCPAIVFAASVPQMRHSADMSGATQWADKCSSAPVVLRTRRCEILLPSSSMMDAVEPRTEGILIATSGLVKEK